VKEAPVYLKVTLTNDGDEPMVLVQPKTSASAIAKGKLG
jgi:hypothetical protein